MAALEEQDLYMQAGEMLRHYLTWREKLLGGYVVVIAGLAIAVATKIDIPHFDSSMSALGALLTVAFWLLDYRNRSLFQTCLDAGAALERGASLQGAFIALNNLPDGPSKPTTAEF